MYDCEGRGLVKMDYLGLKTLRVIDQCEAMVNAVRQYRGDTEQFSIDHVDQRDDMTWKLLGEGKLLGIFQVERTFIQNFARRMNLQNVKDLWQMAVLVAIIRPGMMDAGMTEVYLRRASGQETPVAPHPSLTARLTKTYGCLVFQEELMAVTEIMAGYSKSKADQIRACVTKETMFVSKRRGWISIDTLLADGYKDELFLVMDETGRQQWKRIENLVVYWAKGSFICCIKVRIFS